MGWRVPGSSSQGISKQIVVGSLLHNAAQRWSSRSPAAGSRCAGHTIRRLYTSLMTMALLPGCAGASSRNGLHALSPRQHSIQHAPRPCPDAANSVVLVMLRPRTRRPPAIGGLQADAVIGPSTPAASLFQKTAENTIQAAVRQLRDPTLSGPLRAKEADVHAVRAKCTLFCGLATENASVSTIAPLLRAALG